MKALLDAIYTEWSHATLPLYFAKVPETRESPYCVYHLINAMPEYTFSSMDENVEIQFTVIGDSGDDVLGYLNDVQQIYDDCKLTVTGYEFVKMERGLLSSFRYNENRTWQGIITYEAIIHKAL